MRKSGAERNIAIVGMACVFPSAPDLQTYWQNIVSGIDCIGAPPVANLLHQMYAPESDANDRVYCKNGGFLDRLPLFSASEYGVMPRAVDGAEPEHFMALQVAHSALIDAGYPEIPINKEKTEVILGRGTYVNRGFMSAMQHSIVIDQTISLLQQLHPEYSANTLIELKKRLKEQLPPFSPETAPGLCHNVVAGLIANRLNLQGKNLVLDAACASCLLALEIAADDLRQGKCDAAIVGGVQISTHAPIHLIFTHLGALSRKEHLRPFDKKADGTMLGEGIGMVVLKRLSDGIRDGNRIYAVVKGVGSSSDGKGTGLLAPRIEGEELALNRAYNEACLDPSTIELIEAHGTGIPLGDVTELKALRNVFGERKNGRPRCALGSVKSMIGHLIPAAGIAGIIKTSLALYHKVYPPTLHCDEPNPDLEIDTTPFYLNTTSRPWIHGHDDYPRRAGINAFGFGGINGHVVVEEYNNGGEQFIGEQWDAELFVFKGKNRDDLIDVCRKFSIWHSSSAAADCCLADTAYSLCSNMKRGESRLSVVATSGSDLDRKLAHAIRLLEDKSRVQIKDRGGVYFFEDRLADQGKVAFMFPGEGSQYVDMLSDICRCFPEARSCFDLLDRAYDNLEDEYKPSQFIFPPNGMAEEAGAKIFSMDGAVDAVSTANRALFKVLERLSVFPDAVVGHSSGELMALEASEAVCLTGEDDVLSYIQIGNSIIESLKKADDIPHGRLLAVGGVSVENISEIVDSHEGFLCVAMKNCPHQCVLCGTAETTDSAETVLREMGAICQQLPFQRAYHTELFKPALRRLRGLYEHALFQVPKVALYSCLTADRYPDDPGRIRELALEQWIKPVLFQDTICKMYDDGIRLFIEVGPRANLSSFVGDILKKKPHCTVATNVHHRSGLRQLLHALGLLAAHGVSMKLKMLFENRYVQRVKMDGIPDTKKVVAGIELKRDLPVLHLREEDLIFLRSKSNKESVAPAFQAQEQQHVLNRDSDPIMAEYFQTMEHFLDVQQQTMKGFLSTGKREKGSSIGLLETTSVQPDVKKKDVVQDGKRELLEKKFSLEQASEGDVHTESIKIEKLLLQLVSERTGYPEEMLGLDQDMEAELGIDSIKRVEIFGALAKQLGNLDESRTVELRNMRTLGQIINYLENSSSPLLESHHPFIDKVSEVEAGRIHEIECVLDLDNNRFLRDHNMGGKVSRNDKELHGLAVLPFAMSLEIVAAAAETLYDGKLLTGFGNVTAHKWIVFSKKKVQLTVIAEKKSGENKARTRLYIGKVSDGDLALEGYVFYADSQSPPGNPLSVSPDEVSSMDGIPNQFYPKALFHGPLFQNVQKIMGWGSKGVKAVIESPQQKILNQVAESPVFLTSPFCLDAAGQVIGLWATHFVPEQYVIFPISVDSIVFSSGKDFDHGICLALNNTDGDSIQSDIDILLEDGTPWCSVKGLRHKRLDLPELVHHFRGSRDVMLSVTWKLPLQQLGELKDYNVSFLSAGKFNFSGADGKVLQEVIAHIVLNRRERDAWYGLSYPEDRRREWLLGRVVVKEAIRRLLVQQGCQDIWPADIDIIADKNGQPEVYGPWLKEPGWRPLISLSHSHGNIAAFAVRADNVIGVGIDIEKEKQVDESVKKMILDVDEQLYLTELSKDDAQRFLFSVWCAREAVVKCKGGMGGRSLKIKEMTRDGRVITFNVNNEEEETLEIIPVVIFNKQGLVAAVSITRT